MSSPSFIEFGRAPFPRSDTLSQSGPLNWLSFMCAINHHKLIVIIVIYRKSFLPAYAQLGILGNIFAMVPVLALTATVTEQRK